jgi:coenzyme F420-0:L-glutamate ligase/coenzyme F420-1:gamma-L-glutamate ligase
MLKSVSLNMRRRVVTMASGRLPSTRVPPKIEVFGVKGIPMVKPGDNIARLLVKALKTSGVKLENGDIIVVSQVIVSKAEGRMVKLKDVKPGLKARVMAEKLGKEAEVVELILREALEVLRFRNGHLITRTRHGYVCANSGVDLSNVSGGDAATLLPSDPDLSARKIRSEIYRLTGKRVAVIISDTFGRPFRLGQINVALGVSGMKPIHDRRGEKDLFGRELQVKEIAVADELASAAELVMGEADEGIPIAVIRGYKYEASRRPGGKQLIRPRDKDLFL